MRQGLFASVGVYGIMTLGGSSRRVPTSQFLLGLLVVLVGLILLLDTTGVAPTQSLLQFAPSLFVLVGIWALVGSRFRNLVGPVVLIGVAVAWQLVALDVVSVDRMVDFWPLLVIVLGLSIVLGQYRSSAAEVEGAHTSTFAAFGGVEKRNTSQQFRGADLTAMFGGAELDLRDATVGERPARINAVALFGGVDIIVPREWNVQLDVLPILAGAADDRARTDDIRDEVDLVVTGFAAFGGIAVSD